ncbi:MAG: glutathione S-transferase family protein [Rhodospirillaceae bacterium]
MITLCQFTDKPVWGINPSPFCMKVETYLRLTGLPYQTKSCLPNQAPKGKLPFIIEDDGRLIPDSGVIIEHLEATRGHLLDGSLTLEQQSLGHLIRRTCEENLFFVIAYSRWFDEPGWSILKPLFFGNIPIPIRWIVPGLIRRRIRRDLIGQGILRHNREEIYALGCKDIRALAGLLGNRSFFVTDHTPSSVDVCVYSFLVNIIRPPVDSPLKYFIKQHDNLVSFISRIDKLLET